MADTLSPNSTTAFTSNTDELSYIISRANVYGLDPFAVASIIPHEGITLPSAVGDNGTSFGPWQLHIGGALPADIAAQGPTFAQQWANSPAGINYALSRMATIAKGLTGLPAIAAIVNLFERPKNPGSEITNSYKSYQQYKAAGLISIGPGNSGPVPNPIPGPGGGVNIPNPLSGLAAVGDFFSKLTDPHNLLRAGEVVAGAVLVMVGVYLLARQIGLSAPAPVPVRAAAAAVE